MIEPRLEQAAEVVERRREPAAELGISTIDAEKDSTTIILEELPGIDNESFKAALKSNHPGEAAGYYINGLLTFGIGLATVLAVLMITIGGFQYITTDSFMQKSEGKKRIQDSLMGLGLILVSYLLLGTINSDLLKIRFGLSPISLEKESLSIEFTIEDITTTAVRKNNEGILDRCKKGNRGGGRSAQGTYTPKDQALDNINTQIKELEGYIEAAEYAKSSDSTHLVAGILSENPSLLFGGDYSLYEPGNYFKNRTCSGGRRSRLSRHEQCLSINNYIAHIKKLIAQLKDLKRRCEELP